MPLLQIKEKGTSFPGDEVRRVKKLLAGKVSEAKQEMLQLRLNVLAAFHSAVGDGTKQAPVDEL